MLLANSGLGEKVSGGETVSKDGLSLVCAIGAQEERAAFSGRRVRTTGRYEAWCHSHNEQRREALGAFLSCPFDVDFLLRRGRDSVEEVTDHTRA